MCGICICAHVYVCAYMCGICICAHVYVCVYMCMVGRNHKFTLHTTVCTVASLLETPFIHRVGQNRIYTPCMTVYLMVSLPKIMYIHRIYVVLPNPICTPHIHIYVRFWLTLYACRLEGHPAWPMCGGHPPCQKNHEATGSTMDLSLMLVIRGGRGSA